MGIRRQQRAKMSHLSFQDSKPELLSLDDLASAAGALVAGVQALKLLAPAVCQARGLIGAEEGPLLVALHPPHEQIIAPEAVEQVPRPRLLLAMVLAQVQPIEDVCMPGLQVDGKGSLALAAPLVHIPTPQHQMRLFDIYMYININKPIS